MSQKRRFSLALASLEKELLISLTNQSNWHDKIIERFAIQMEKKSNFYTSNNNLKVSKNIFLVSINLSLPEKNEYNTNLGVH